MNVDTKRNMNEEKLAEEEVVIPESFDTTEEHDLLAGYKDDSGVVHKTFTVRDITGEDEEFINRSDIKSNGAKVATALLTRCVTSIGTLTKKELGPKKWESIFKEGIFVGDRDIMLLTLRKQSTGEEIEVVHTCPNPQCKAKLKTVINVDELDIIPYDGMETIPFTLPKGYVDHKGVLHREGTMRRPNGLDAELLTPLAKNNMAKATSLLLARICTFNDGAHVDQSVMAKLTLKDRTYLQELLNEHSFGVDMTVPVMCDQCGEEFRGNLNQSNFI